MTKIVPLSIETLNETTALAKKIFVDSFDRKISELSLKESLSERNSKKTYWIAVEKEKKVVGIIGLYLDPGDRNAVWLGWFGVHPEYRRDGIGSALLEFAIDEAKKRGFGILRLYTSSDENERVAHELYKKFGFVQLDTDENSDKIYFVRSLTGH